WAAATLRAAGIERPAAPDAPAEGARPKRLSFGASAKKALEQALREALALGQRHIGTEHVVLGALAAGGDDVDAALEALGITSEALRNAALSVIRDSAA